MDGQIVGSQQFRKRFYTLGRFLADVRVVVSRRADSRAIWLEHRLDPQLREAVMLGVSRVNACGFCTYVHYETAWAEGADTAVLTDLDLSEVADQDHAVAVVWAQSRSEHGLRPADDVLERALAERFTDQQRRDLDTVVRVMTLANLTGNTLEALVWRIRGRTVTGSRLIDELLIGTTYALGAPVQGLLTARMRGKSPLVATREAAAMIRAAAA